MSSALTKAIDDTRARYNSAYNHGLSLKASGISSVLDMGPMQGLSQLDQFRDNSKSKQSYAHFRGWVHSAVNAIAKAAAKQKVNFGRIEHTSDKDDEKPKGKDKLKPGKQILLKNKMTTWAREKAAEEDVELILDDPFYQALQQPNSIQGRWQFVYSFVANLCLTGWSWIVCDKVEDEGYQFYVLPTTWVKPIHEKGPFQQIKIVNPRNPESHQDAKPLDRDQFAFAYIPNPSDMFSALAPAAAQGLAISIDEKIQTSQDAFFGNGIFPSMIVKVGANPHPDVPGGIRPRLSPAQRSQVIGAIKKTTSGMANYGNPAIVDGFIEGFERMSATSNEMGWEKSEKVARARILSAFGVHPFILGEEMAGSHAQAYTVKEVFYENVNAFLDMISSCMTHFAGVMTEDSDTLVWWEQAKPVDPSMEQSKWERARDRDDVTQNEFRTLYMSLPPDEDERENILGKNAKDVLAAAQAVKGGQLEPEQGWAYLEAMGLPEDVAKKIAGEGPSEEDKQAKLAQQQAMMAGAGPPKPGQKPDENVKPGDEKKPPKSKEEEVVENVEKALIMLQTPLQIDLKGIEDLSDILFDSSKVSIKNCGIGSGGFQPGNTCARGGGGGVRTNVAGEEFHPATRGEDKVWRTPDGKEAPEHIQKLGIPPAWKDVHVNLNPKGNVLATGIDAKGRGQSKYSANHTMQAAADKFGRVTELRQKRKEIFAEVEEDIRSGQGKIKENALVTKLIMKTGMRPGSDSDTGAEYKSYGATTLEGRHIVKKSDGSVVARFVPGKKKGQEIEMPITDTELANQLLKRSKEVGANGRMFNTTASSVRDYSKGKDGGGFKTKDHRTALGTETAIGAIKSIPKPTTMKEYKAAVKEVSTKVSDVLGNTPSIAFKSYIDPQVWTEWTKGIKK